MQAIVTYFCTYPDMCVLVLITRLGAAKDTEIIEIPFGSRLVWAKKSSAGFGTYGCHLVNIIK